MNYATQEQKRLLSAVATRDVVDASNPGKGMDKQPNNST
jgi:hypothetical protein